MGEIMELLMGLKNKAKRNKKKLYFLVGLALIGFISGSLFTTFLSKTDEALVTEYIKNFINTIKGNNLDYIDVFKNAIFSNMLYIFIIWILGISIIGLPINVFIYFVKTFMIGFSLSSIFLAYKFKGLAIVIIYLLPQLLNIIILLILMVFSINFSLRLLNSILKRSILDFKTLFNNYLGILLLTVVLIFISSLIEVFMVPTVINKLILLF